MIASFSEQFESAENLIDSLVRCWTSTQGGKTENKTSVSSPECKNEFKKSLQINQVLDKYSSFSPDGNFCIAQQQNIYGPKQIAQKSPENFCLSFDSSGRTIQFSSISVWIMIIEWPIVFR